jgi:FkbM family methyltransferase
MLTTKTKVALAGAAYKVISFARSVVGKNDRVEVKRHGLRWALDLGEGIDFSIYLLGAFEAGTQATLQKLVRPGDVVFDIGANIGAHTLGIAQSVGAQGRVFAFEPADFAFEKLRRNLALNPALAARTFPQQALLTASSLDRKEPQIYASWPLQKSGAVHPKHRGQLVSTARARVETLPADTGYGNVAVHPRGTQQFLPGIYRPVEIFFILVAGRSQQRRRAARSGPT